MKKEFFKKHLREGEKLYLILGKEKGYISGDLSYHVEITKDFWDAICEILFIGYIDIEKE